MSDETGHPEEQDNSEQQLLDLLDRYVDELHHADEVSRSALLERHVELTELAGCLDALDSLAIPLEPGLRVKPDSSSSQLTVMESSDGPPAGAGSVDADAVDGLPSQNFGKYRLEAEIGRGGMGVVYRAWQGDLDRAVALKMILSSRLASVDDVRRFYAEAKAAAGGRHPHIVGIHEVGQVHGQHYFAMDHIAGRSLAQLLGDGPLDAERAARCVAAVARAVHFLHERNIVHRDLKPSNILVDEDDTPFVTDFGLAKVFASDSADTQTGTILGTPSYMSPEQAAGRSKEISPLSDVYSLGAILYETLCGRPPFQERRPLDTLVQVLEGEPPMLSRVNPRVPRELELICVRCLEKDPRARYSSAEELADDLERYLRGEPIEARPSGLMHSMVRWTRREPALASRLAGIAVAAAIVQAAYLYNLPHVDSAYHVKIMSILAAWASASFLFQRLLNRDSLAAAARFAWAGADAAFLTLVLGVIRGPLGPLLIGYPLLVAASGLFFRVRLVWFMTAACLISYVVLLGFHPEQRQPPHYPMIFGAVLVVLGVMVAYQVYRVRVLSRYFNRRQWP